MGIPHPYALGTHQTSQEELEMNYPREGSLASHLNLGNGNNTTIVNSFNGHGEAGLPGFDQMNFQDNEDPIIISSDDDDDEENQDPNRDGGHQN